MSQATEQQVMTTFSCHAPQAEHVSVAGTFNDWCANTNMMKKGAKGKWTTKIKLAPGRYEFKFIVVSGAVSQAAMVHTPGARPALRMNSER